MTEEEFLEYMKKQPDSFGKAWAMLFYWSLKLALMANACGKSLKKGSGTA